MNTYSRILPYIEDYEYEHHFWNALRGKPGHKEHLVYGIEDMTGAFILTAKGQSKYMAAIEQESLFRSIATDLKVYDYDYRIKTIGTDDVSVWAPEGGTIPITDGMADFGETSLSWHKVAVFFKLEDALVRDPFFKIEDYLIKRLAKNFGRAEDNGFINGTGVNMPTGILAENGGAEIGVTADTLTYDDVIKLFFSVKPEYRRNGTWLMNDETALALRSLKDDAGNYIWNHANDTILGHKARISEFMPNAESGNKPIAFGDFSYYWIVGRRPISIRTLTEQFIHVDCIGYLAYEFLDGKLVRPEAIKVLKIEE